MERSASHLVVGSFMLLLIAGLAGLVVWLARLGEPEQDRYYYIYFRGAVTGLQTGSPVRYRGVPVGSVKQIEIDAQNVELIEVTVALNPTTPVKIDTVATLQLQGITGLSFVQLQGGTQEAALLQPAPGKRRAVIPSVPSPFERLIESAPSLLMQLDTLATRAADLVNDQNQEAIATILNNLKETSTTLLAGSERINRTLAGSEEVMENVKQAAEGIAQLTKGGEKMIATLTTTFQQIGGDTRQTMAELRTTTGAFSTDARQLIAEARAAAAAIGRSAAEIQALARDARDPVRNLARGGLIEVGELVVETRGLVTALSRVITLIERDPARFLFGDQQKGFEGK